MNQPSLFGSERGGSARANVDGGSRGNPGPAGYGVRIEQEDGTIVELKESIGMATNNVAEYSGLIAALAWAVAARHLAAARPRRFRSPGQTDARRVPREEPRAFSPCSSRRARSRGRSAT